MIDVTGVICHKIVSSMTRFSFIFFSDVPSITGEKEFAFSQGQKATITCEAKCVPKPIDVIWRRERTGEIIKNGDSSRYVGFSSRFDPPTAKWHPISKFV